MDQAGLKAADGGLQNPFTPPGFVLLDIVPHPIGLAFFGDQTAVDPGQLADRFGVIVLGESCGVVDYRADETASFLLSL